MKILKERGNSLFRTLDRYIGIPLLFLLSLFKQKKTAPQTHKKVGILKLAAIGDTVLLAHCLYTLKKTHPLLEIIFFSGKTNAEIASFLPVDRVQPLSVFSPLQAIRTLRKERLCVLIDCEAWSRITAFFAFFSKAKYRIGFKTKGQCKHLAFDRAESHSFSRHERDNFAALFQCFEMGPLIPYPFLKSAPLKQRNPLILHLFPGGSQALLKQWPNAYWSRLLSLLNQFQLDIYATGSRKDRLQIEAALQGFSIKNVAGKLSLGETMALLQKAECVVSVDTGIMHLAGALNVPTICLHGPTDPKRWGALGKNVYPFTSLKDHSPCIQLGFENPCKLCRESMTLISPEQVFEKIKTLLKK